MDVGLSSLFLKDVLGPDLPKDNHHDNWSIYCRLDALPFARLPKSSLKIAKETQTTDSN